MGDRVAVLRDGILQQLAAPQELYDRPTNLFVASFMGSPSMNLYEAAVIATDDEVEVALGVAAAHGARRRGAALSDPERAATGRLVVGIRPEELSPPRTNATGATRSRAAAWSSMSSWSRRWANEQLVHFALDAPNYHDEGERVGEDTEDLATRIAGTPVGKGVARVDPRARLTSGARTTLAVDCERLHFFDPDGGAALAKTKSEHAELRA